MLVYYVITFGSDYEDFLMTQSISDIQAWLMKPEVQTYKYHRILILSKCRDKRPEDYVGSFNTG